MYATTNRDPNTSKKVLLYLLDNKVGDPKHIGKEMRLKPDNVSQALFKLKTKGQVQSIGYGRYELTEKGRPEALQFAESDNYLQYGKEPEQPVTQRVPAPPPAAAAEPKAEEKRTWKTAEETLKEELALWQQRYVTLAETVAQLHNKQ